MVGGDRMIYLALVGMLTVVWAIAWTAIVLTSVVVKIGTKRWDE